MSKYEGSNLLASVACPGPVTPLPPAAPQPVSLTHQAMDTITTEDQEEMEVNTTMTDKVVDVQSSRTKSRSVERLRTKSQIVNQLITCRDSCRDALTLVYGHVLVVAGVVLPLLSFFSEVEKSSSEMFYIYLLLAGILYLCFVQIDLMYLK